MILDLRLKNRPGFKSQLLCHQGFLIMKRNLKPIKKKTKILRDYKQFIFEYLRFE